MGDLASRTKRPCGERRSTCLYYLSVKRRENSFPRLELLFFLEFLNYWGSPQIVPVERCVTGVSWQLGMVLWHTR